MYDREKMKKIIILIPVFNDWESLKRLLNEINENIQDIKNVIFECFVVNDASTIEQPELIKPNNIGDASQIPGVSKADLTALLVWLRIKELKNDQFNNSKKKLSSNK